MTLQEIEEVEALVWQLSAPYYTGYPQRDFSLETYILNKTLYYIKLGVYPQELRDRLEKIRLKINRVKQ
jgi:hypothetical protein